MTTQPTFTNNNVPIKTDLFTQGNIGATEFPPILGTEGTNTQFNLATDFTSFDVIDDGTTYDNLDLGTGAPTVPSILATGQTNLDLGVTVGGITDGNFPDLSGSTVPNLSGTGIPSVDDTTYDYGTSFGATQATATGSADLTGSGTETNTIGGLGATAGPTIAGGLELSTAFDIDGLDLGGSVAPGTDVTNFAVNPTVEDTTFDITAMLGTNPTNLGGSTAAPGGTVPSAIGTEGTQFIPDDATQTNFVNPGVNPTGTAFVVPDSNTQTNAISGTNMPGVATGTNIPLGVDTTQNPAFTNPVQVNTGTNAAAMVTGGTNAPGTQGTGMPDAVTQASLGTGTTNFDKINFDSGTGSLGWGFDGLSADGQTFEFLPIDIHQNITFSPSFGTQPALPTGLAPTGLPSGNTDKNKIQTTFQPQIILSGLPEAPVETNTFEDYGFGDVITVDPNAKIPTTRSTVTQAKEEVSRW